MLCLMRPHLIRIYNHKANPLVITYNQAKPLICLTISLIPSCYYLHNEHNKYVFKQISTNRGVCVGKCVIQIIYC